jgi:hypothetical protein
MAERRAKMKDKNEYDIGCPNRVPDVLGPPSDGACGDGGGGTP